jgi:hypothetical protein
MSADEHAWDLKGPPTLIDLHGVLDGEVNPDRVKRQIEGSIGQTTTPL